MAQEEVTKAIKEDLIITIQEIPFKPRRLTEEEIIVM